MIILDKGGEIMTDATFSNLLEKTKSSFSNTISRIINVAGCNEKGEPCYLKKTKLAERSGIARSSIAKYFSDDHILNPDLRTICRLAHAFNIPPAFLLMRVADWKNIATFSLSAENIFSDVDCQLMLGEILKAKKSNERAKKCLNLAHYLSQNKVSSDKKLFNCSVFSESIFPASALPPLGEIKDEQLACLYLLSVQIGTNLLGE